MHKAGTTMGILAALLGLLGCTGEMRRVMAHGNSTLERLQEPDLRARFPTGTTRREQVKEALGEEGLSMIPRSGDYPGFAPAAVEKWVYSWQERWESGGTMFGKHRTMQRTAGFQWDADGRLLQLDLVTEDSGPKDNGLGKAP